MIHPKVSIIMPNLNNRCFIEERLDTILSQTLTDWELIIIDSYSTDGTWQLIQEYATKEPRMRIFQMPREGIYPAINQGILQAKGEYIYIATSDDTMMPECLGKMVTAMDDHTICDICHTSLKVIDEKGIEIPGWWRKRPATQFYGDLEDKKHIRFAPYDGILYCVLHVVYGSLTQLLIRRSTFDKTGLFRSDWGSRGDFEWGMRAGLVCNTLHFPETLATWRKHKNQATEYSKQSSNNGVALCEMVKAAIPLLKEHYPEIYKKIHWIKLISFYRKIQLTQKIKRCNNLFEKIYVLFLFFFINPIAAKDAVISHIIGKVYLDISNENVFYIKKELLRLGLSENIKVLR
jgi:glycosyltransferase involved in cell wall biosynthesis